jgi:hypothetical protein
MIIFDRLFELIPAALFLCANGLLASMAVFVWLEARRGTAPAVLRPSWKGVNHNDKY